MIARKLSDNVELSGFFLWCCVFNSSDRDNKTTEEVTFMKPVIGIVLLVCIIGVYVYIQIRNHRKK